jgi:hypothetical protein
MELKMHLADGVILDNEMDYLKSLKRVMFDWRDTNKWNDYHMDLTLSIEEIHGSKWDLEHDFE